MAESNKEQYDEKARRRGWKRSSIQLVEGNQRLLEALKVSDFMWKKPFKFMRKKKLKPSSMRANALLELQDNLSTKFNVSEEYRNACRTNSYVEMWTRVHDQMGSASDDQQNNGASSSRAHNGIFNGSNLRELHLDNILALPTDSNLHELILDYFNGSMEAVKICCCLLQSINKTRRSYMKIDKALSLISKAQIDSNENDKHNRTAIGKLVQFVGMTNPFSPTDQTQFSRVHKDYGKLVARLTNTYKSALKRMKVIGICKKVLKIKRLDKKSSLFQLSAQLEAAAKGAYILERHFDTMTRIITSLYDEIEHTRALTEIFMRNQNSTLLREVVEQIENSKASLYEQLKELEELVYLCFVTINRATTLVLQEVL